MAVIEDSWLEEAQPNAKHPNDDQLHSKSQPGDGRRPVYEFDVSGYVPGQPVLTLVHGQPGHFTEAHQRFVEAAAEQVAVALHHAERFDAMQRMADRQALLDHLYGQLLPMLVAPVAKNDLPLAVKADSIEGLVPLIEKLTEAGLKDLVIDPGSREIKQSHQDQIAMRRAALKDGNRMLGFPSITFPCEMASNLDMETLIAGTFIAKYGGIVVLSDFSGESLIEGESRDIQGTATLVIPIVSCVIRCLRNSPPHLEPITLITNI